MIKDEWEIEQLRHAVDATVGGVAAVATEIPRALAQGLGERWLQGTFERHSRTHGNGPGYSTIVGSGPNAPILHWTRCDGPILPDSADRKSVVEGTRARCGRGVECREERQLTRGIRHGYK